ncbi:Hypothetical_protein [Hexamita inflata]|uniref:Hypothetical_protein n=1 Tax=Hexamita inflata TaxID=28002 RepID=A0AA86PJT1_9EUKA|nr:Hypothetical protein HINF_LOCUS27341 [Hexamita inflata]
MTAINTEVSYEKDKYHSLILNTNETVNSLGPRVLTFGRCFACKFVFTSGIDSMAQLQTSWLTRRENVRRPSYTESVCRAIWVHLQRESRCVGGLNAIRPVQCKFHKKLIRQPARRRGQTYGDSELIATGGIGYSWGYHVGERRTFQPAAVNGEAVTASIHAPLEEAAAQSCMRSCLELVESGFCGVSFGIKLRLQNLTVNVLKS